MADAVAEVVGDFGDNTQGGGGFTIVAAGEHARLRLRDYIEYGNFLGEYEGKPKTRPDFEIELTFEVTGQHWPVREHEGKQFVDTIRVKMNKSHTAKSAFPRVFKQFATAMGKPDARTFLDLLGCACMADIFHKPGVKDPKKMYPQLVNPVTKAWHVRPTTFSNPLDGTVTSVPVDPLRGAQRCFMWGAPTQFLEAMWNSIYIEGTREIGEGDKKRTVSKNWIQERIMSAVDFKGSPLHEWLEAKGVSLAIPEATKVADVLPPEVMAAASAQVQAADPLAGMMG